MKLPEGKPPRCPKCGSDNVAFILYNPIDMTDEIIAVVQTKRVVLYPAERAGQNLQYYCFHCGYEW